MARHISTYCADSLNTSGRKIRQLGPGVPSVGVVGWSVADVAVLDGWPVSVGTLVWGGGSVVIGVSDGVPVAGLVAGGVSIEVAVAEAPGVGDVTVVVT
jgi:hypothetical protein